MSSREIAELTGKDHRNVLRDGRAMLVELHGDGGLLRFEHTFSNEQNGQAYPILRLPKRETLILVSGYSLQLRTAIIDRWDELERDASARPRSPSGGGPVTPALAFNGVDIRDRGDRLCLTDMWRAAGSPVNREPFNWACFEGKAFIDAVTLTHNLSQAQVIATTRGRNGVTMAHWQVGMGYAQYLSPDFHMWCNTVVRERMEGRPVVPTGSSAEQIERTYGISRMVAGKVTALERAVEVLTEQNSKFVEALLHPDHVGAREVLDGARVPSRGRRPLLARTTRGLDLYSRQHQHSIRREAFTRRKLFHLQAVAEWRQTAGDALIARHMDAVVGQGRLQLGKDA